MLNLLEHYDIGSMQPNSAEHLHLFIEAKKLAFEDRATFYADPAFNDAFSEYQELTFETCFAGDDG